MADRRVDTAFAVSGRDVERVEIRVARGTLTIAGSDSPDIEVRATRRSTIVDPRLVDVRWSRRGDSLRIVARHPSPPPGPPRECLLVDEELGDFWHDDVTVDLALSVPTWMALKMSTMRGRVEVTRVSGDVDIATNDGPVQLRELGGGFSVTAVGTIDFDVNDTPRAAVRRASTYGGDIRIHVPPNRLVRIADTIAAANDLPREVVRVKDAVSVAIAVRVGSDVPIHVELVGGGLLLVPGAAMTPR
jgi:hypothetical protein